MFLWIDPWVRKLGFALITKDLKIIESWILLQEKKSPTRDEQYDRIVKIMEFFDEMNERHSKKIKTVSVEKLFFTHSNQRNAEFVYGVRGALIAFFKKNWCSILEYSPIELKKHITGNWKAQKMFVQKMIMQLFNLSNLPDYDDAADALGLAYLASKKSSY